MADDPPNETALFRIREDRHLTQAELGARVGLSQAQIARLEVGARQLKPDRAKQLAKVLECHWLDLMEEPRPDLTPQEQALVELYRGLSESDRAAVYRIADAMAEPRPLKKPQR